MTWAMPVAAAWILLGPVLMVMGELCLASTLGELRRTQEDGWNMEALLASRRSVLRLRLPVVGLFLIGSLSGYVLGHEWFEANLGVGRLLSLTWIMGFLVLTQIGLASGFGLWGVIQALSVVRVATRTVIGRDAPPWAPFRPDQVPGVEALAYFAIASAVMFSCGSVMAPAIAMVAFEAGGVASVLLFVAVAVLLLGGLVLFLVPVSMVRSLTKRQMDRHLTVLALELEQAHLEVRQTDAPTAEQYRRWRSLLEYWLASSTYSARPSSIARLSSLPVTFVVPVSSVVATLVGLLVR